MALGIADMAVFCKKKGFVYPNSEIYGGISGFWDYGHLGSELKNNLKQMWWKFHVHSREDIVGIDGSIITHPKVWVASGHVESFVDILLECTKCRERYRGDQLVEDVLKISADGMKADDINKLVRENKIHCRKCGSALGEASPFNLMFSTEIGASGGLKSYLRPETAQLIFTNFKLVEEHARMKLPFGIAQMGKAFRNEISPRDFLFRCREFEQMEIEYFIHPNQTGKCPFLNEVEDMEVNIFSAEMQENNKPHSPMKLKDAVKKKIIQTPWHAYFLGLEISWFTSLGVNQQHLRARQHLRTEKSHYALDTWDLEYKFPFGWKELLGMANRTDYDLKAHSEHSKKDLSIFDEESKQKVIPHVVCEPSLGVDRAFLVFLFDAYNNDEARGNIVLKLHPKIAPIKVGVFPLVNKLDGEARKAFESLKRNFYCFYDRSGSIGRRYARADEIGIPYCVTIDFETLKDNSVTIRDRDTTEQVRVKIDGLPSFIEGLINGKPFGR
ncbi:glycine--tRNA ligase [Candidatus Woesearchaeota archaeon]|nr:glycine--tRNA ligase [Candidatus Woesearchaeota archaeon]